MKTKLTMLLIVFLSACTTSEVVVERCLVKLETQECRCHQYRISEDYVGRIGNSTDHPIEKCDRLVGFSPDDYAEILKILRDHNLLNEKEETQKDISKEPTVIGIEADFQER